MRQARRYGGEVIRLSRQARVVRPRRLVVLCDISGSMEPYARALLLLMYVLYGGQVAGGRPSSGAPAGPSCSASPPG